MTIREFQSKLNSVHASSTLLAGLRKLCSVEDPKLMSGDDVTTNADWILWGEVGLHRTQPGLTGA